MQDEVSIPAFKLDHTGLTRFFGELEARVMEIVWQLEEATVNDVLDRLGDDQYHYNTIMTVMSRLTDKGILTRRREGRAHVYAPVEDRDIFLTRVSHDVAEGLLREFGAVAIAQFVDAASSVDPQLIAELRRRVQGDSGDAHE